MGVAAVVAAGCDAPAAVGPVLDVATGEQAPPTIAMTESSARRRLFMIPPPRARTRPHATAGIAPPDRLIATMTVFEVTTSRASSEKSLTIPALPRIPAISA